MNGDSLIDTSIAAFVSWASTNVSGSALIATETNEASRYGILRLNKDGFVEAFDEKPEYGAQGWINAGVYWLDASALQLIASIGRGSLEQEILPRLPPGHLAAYCSSGRFIDIGTPESLACAARWPTEVGERCGDQCA
jgi:mannose-1-phosphate guanylyltransferase